MLCLYLPGGIPISPGQSGEAHVFPVQDDNLTAELPLRRSILQSTLRQKYRSTGKHNSQRDGGPEKGLYRLHPIALPWKVNSQGHPAHSLRKLECRYKQLHDLHSAVAVLWRFLSEDVFSDQWAEAPSAPMPV